MAYISKEEIAEIRKNIKARFPLKEGWKFSIRGQHHSSINVTVTQCPAAYEFEGYHQVNPYYIEKQGQDFGWSKREIDMVKELTSIITAKHWDDSDTMTDYFNCAFYYNVHVGAWDKPVIRKAA